MIILTGYQGFIGKEFTQTLWHQNLYRVEMSHCFQFLEQFEDFFDLCNLFFISDIELLAIFCDQVSLWKHWDTFGSLELRKVVGGKWLHWDVLLLVDVHIGWIKAFALESSK